MLVPDVVSTSRSSRRLRSATRWRTISTSACTRNVFARWSCFLHLNSHTPQTPATSPQSGRGFPTLEDLGKQSFAGLETEGTRETTVIEAGAIGNDTPILVRREYGYSPQLSLNIVSKLQDPRVGTQNFEVSDIVLGEPDAKLFKRSGNSKLIDLRKSVNLPPPNDEPPN